MVADFAQETRFRKAFEIAVHGMALASVQGRFLQVNAAFCSLLGYSESELLATNFQSITHLDDLDDDLRQMKRLFSGEIESYQMEKRYRHKNGKILWGQLAVSLVRGPDGQPLYFVAQIQDLTAEKLLKEANRRYQDHFRLLVQGVKDFAIYTLDPNGRITSWNAGARRIKRYELGDVVGQSFDMFFSQSDRDAGEPGKILEIARREGKFEGGGVRLRGDGTLFMAHVVLDAVKNEDGDLVGFTKVTRDIAEMRSAATNIAPTSGATT